MLLPQILQYDFMIRALIAGTVIAIAAPLIGSFLLIRRYSVFADTLAHVSFLSVAVAILFGLNPILTSIVGALLASSALEHLRVSKRIQSENSLALFLSGSLALGVVILSLAKTTTINISSILFGSITTITQSDLAIIAAIALVVIIIMMYNFRNFFVIAFDEDYARVKGIRVTLLNYTLMLASALIISVSINVIGMLLIGALMVIPVITAYQFKRGFKHSVIIAIVFALAEVWLGLTAAFYLDLPAGSSIVLISILFFGIATLLRKK